MDVRAPSLLWVVLLAALCGCGGGDDPVDAAAPPAPCLGRTELPGGAVAEWFSSGPCGQAGEQCIFGACVCAPRCGDGQLVAVQSLRLADRGVRGLAGARVVAPSPDGKHVYVAASRDGVITVLTAPPELAPVPGLEVALTDGGDGVTALAIRPDGAELLAGLGSTSTLVALTRDAASGALGAGGAPLFGPFDGVRDIAFAGVDSALTAARGEGAVAALSRGPDGWTVAATLKGPALKGVSVVEVVGGAPDVAWAGAGEAGAVVRLTRSGDAWAIDRTETLVALAGLQDLAVSPDEQHLYVAGWGGVHAFSLQGGGLVEVGAGVPLPAPHGIEHGYSDETPSATQAIALSPAGDLVLSTSFFGGYVLVWDRDPASGALTGGRVADYQPVYSDDNFDEEETGQNSPLGFDPETDIRLAAFEPDPSGERLYLTSGLWDAVAALRFDGEGAPRTEAVRQHGDGGLTNLGGAYNIVLSPDQRHLYVGAWNSEHPSAFARDEATGTLTPLPEPQSASGEKNPVNYGHPDLAITADGASILSIDDQFNQVHAYDRDPESGALTLHGKAGAELPFDLLVSITLTPDGRSVYAGDFFGNQVGTFTRDPASRDIASGPLLVHGEGGLELEGVEDIVVSDDSRHVYVVAYFSAAVTVFDRDPDTTELAMRQVLSPKSGSSGLFFGMEAGAITPDGTRMVLISPVTETLALCERDPMSGDLALLWHDQWERGKWGPDLRPGLPSPGRVAVVPGGGAVAISLRRWGSVAGFALREDPPSLEWIDTYVPSEALYPTLEFANGVAVTGDGRTVYIASLLGDSLTVFQRNTAAPGADDGCMGTCP